MNLRLSNISFQKKEYSYLISSATFNMNRVDTGKMGPVADLRGQVGAIALLFRRKILLGAPFLARNAPLIIILIHLFSFRLLQTKCTGKHIIRTCFLLS